MNPIRIETYPTTDCLVGKSHWWGAPDLPEGMPYPYEMIEDGDSSYPEPLTFVCQIRLKDISELDKNNLLPHQGILYIFAPIDYHLGYIDSPLDYHTKPIVIYSEQEDNLKPYELTWDDTGESVFMPAEAIRFIEGPQQMDTCHAMLCKPSIDDIADAHPDSICLLQVDEDERWHLHFYDLGTYFILIPKAALIARDWSATFGDMFFY